VSLKKLAGQTMWYGVSNIAARLLTYLLTPYLTYVVFTSGSSGQAEFGRYSFIYLLFPLMNVLYTYGMETSYFRFSQTEDQQKLYRTQFTSMLLSTGFLTLLLIVFRQPLAVFANVEQHIEYIGWCAAIISLDALSALPYARLRKENRPRRYAATKVLGIVVFVATIFILFSFGESLSQLHPAFRSWYQNHWGLGFILFANLLQAALTLLLLSKELRGIKLQIDPAILKRVLIYGLPILITGFAGNINEQIGRVMFEKMYPVKSSEESLRLLGIFTATVRLSIMINLAIQAFKMAAEPFFFSVSKDKNAPETYARVMKWFVIALGVMFLSVALFLDVWKYFVGPEFRDALALVPVLLLSYVFLGIYYNLTVWYKLSDKTQYGMFIMLIGAVVTIVFNYLLIRDWGYAACAWGALLCNGVMMVLSYYWGQKFYPIPYNTGKLLGYLGIMLTLFLVQAGVSSFSDHAAIRLLTGLLLFLIFLVIVVKRERTELKKFPIVGKYL